MAVTQQLARVNLAYLEECRATAARTPNGSPGWSPPAADTLDTDWAVWGLVRVWPLLGGDPQHADTLRRSIDGEPDGTGPDIAFLDHDDVYDGFGRPAALLTPAAVAETAAALDALGVFALADVLGRLSGQDPREAAAACGFPGFSGDLVRYFQAHFDALGDFYRGAAHRRLAVVVWID